MDANQQAMPAGILYGFANIHIYRQAMPIGIFGEINIINFLASNAN